MMTESQDRKIHWYALYTKPQAEYQVASLLQRLASTLDSGEIETYLPEIVTMKANKQQKKEPLFPTYLFAKIDFDVVPFARIRTTPGLRRLVTFGDELDTRLLEVPAQVIDWMQQHFGDITTVNNQGQTQFQTGDRVEILDGPFAGKEAIFEGPCTPSERVEVLLEVLGAMNRVHVPIEDLQGVLEDEDASAVKKRPRRTRGRGRYIKYDTPELEAVNV